MSEALVIAADPEQSLTIFKVRVLLTGMGRDGAEGLLAMRRAGQTTIAQDQASSAVYGMPRAAAEIDAAQMVLPLQKIAAVLRSTLGGKS